MTRLRFLLLVGLAGAGTAFTQPPGGQAPIAGSPKVEVRGKVESDRIARGEGMPFIEVKTPNGTTKVVLGSIRYLLEQDFNPKAGDEVSVKGYKLNDSVVAISVELNSTGKVLKLRDDNGRPVWMGGRRGGPMKKSFR
jgi:hypothetical protein